MEEKTAAEVSPSQAAAAEAAAEGENGETPPGWRVYLLRCADHSLYCGVTNDLEGRLAAHRKGKGAKYTRSRLPLELACFSCAMRKNEALRLEQRIKRLPADRKMGELSSWRDRPEP